MSKVSQSTSPPAQTTTAQNDRILFCTDWETTHWLQNHINQEEKKKSCLFTSSWLFAGSSKVFESPAYFFHPFHRPYALFTVPGLGQEKEVPTLW